MTSQRFAAKNIKTPVLAALKPDGIVLRTKSGIVKLYFIELPKEVEERDGRDAAKTTAPRVRFKQR